MNGVVMGLLAETALHPGSGQTTGVIDLPVAREATTQYPVIAGSSLKGALRDKAEQENWEELQVTFGSQEAAGAVAVTDARLLLLPVRSLSGHYRWVTCPYILERLARDLEMISVKKSGLELDLAPGQAVVFQREETLFLEELTFQTVVDEETVKEMVEQIKPLIFHSSVKDRLSRQLVVLSDDDFAHFAKYGLSVQARNVLDDQTKESKNLWYEESLPPDTLFYGLLLSRPGHEEKLGQLTAFLQGAPYLQIGGNETIGQGWCAVSMIGAGGGSDVGNHG